MSEGVFQRMELEGVFDGGRIKNIVLLVHGWHGSQTTDPFFKYALRLYQIAFPSTCMLYVSWDPQGAQGSVKVAARSSVRVDLGFFLKDIDPRLSDLQCVGHGFGAHACAAFCRHWRQLREGECTRILALAPAYDFIEQSSDFAHRVTKHDADYVVGLIVTNQAKHASDFHEFLSGPYDTLCYNKTWSSKCLGSGCVDASLVDLADRAGLVAVSCDSMLTLLLFMDMNSALPLVSPFPRHYMPFEVVGANPAGLIPSIWSPTVTSKEYSYPNFFDSRTVRYIHMWNGTSPQTLILVVTPRNEHVTILQVSETFHARVSSYRVTIGYSLLSYPSNVTLISMSKPDIVRIMHAAHLQAEKGKFLTEGFDTQPLQCFSTGFTNLTHSLFSCNFSGSAFPVAQYRSPLAPHRALLPVPPKQGCLPVFSDLSDLIETYSNVSIPVGGTLLISLDFLAFPFVKLSLSIPILNCSVEHALVTFFDVCSHLPSFLDVSLNPERHAVVVFYESGPYVLKLYSAYEVTVFSVTVTGEDNENETTSAVLDAEGRNSGFCSGDDSDADDDDDDDNVIEGRHGESPMSEPETIVAVVVSTLVMVLIVVVVTVYCYVQGRERMPASLSLTRYIRKEWGDGDDKVEGESDRLESSAL